MRVINSSIPHDHRINVVDDALVQGYIDCRGRCLCSELVGAVARQLAVPAALVADRLPIASLRFPELD